MPEVANLPEGLHLIFKGVTGSTAYGLATPTSDIDRKAVFVRDTPALLGLNRPDSTYTSHDPDIEAHELGKYLSLVLTCNPNLVELLWLPEELIEIQHQYWHTLVLNRDRLVHTDGVRASYGGYAMQQAKRLLNRVSEGKVGFASDVVKRTEKHARHCIRLIDQAKELLSTGNLSVVVKDPERLFEIGRLAGANPYAFYELFEEEDEKLQAIESVLPDKPDSDWANAYLVWVRRHFL